MQPSKKTMAGGIPSGHCCFRALILSAILLVSPYFHLMLQPIEAI